MTRRRAGRHSQLLFLPRDEAQELDGSGGAVHNLFCQPFLFADFIAASAGVANEEGSSRWPLIGCVPPSLRPRRLAAVPVAHLRKLCRVECDGAPRRLFETCGITEPPPEHATQYCGVGGTLRPADQHCHLVGDPPIELEPGMFFAPEPEWLIGADMARMGLEVARPVCTAVAACVEVGGEGACRCLLARMVVVDALAVAALGGLVGAAGDEPPFARLEAAAGALRGAGLLDDGAAAALAAWRGD